MGTHVLAKMDSLEPVAQKVFIIDTTQSIICVHSLVLFCVDLVIIPYTENMH